MEISKAKAEKKPNTLKPVVSLVGLRELVDQYTETLSAEFGSGDDYGNSEQTVVAGQLSDFLVWLESLGNVKL